MAWSLTQKQQDEFGLEKTTVNWQSLRAVGSLLALAIMATAAHVSARDQINHNNMLSEARDRQQQILIDECREDVRTLRSIIDDPEGILKGAEKRVSRMEGMLEELLRRTERRERRQ